MNKNKSVSNTLNNKNYAFFSETSAAPFSEVNNINLSPTSPDMSSNIADTVTPDLLHQLFKNKKGGNFDSSPVDQELLKISLSDSTSLNNVEQSGGKLVFKSKLKASIGAGSGSNLAKDSEVYIAYLDSDNLWYKSFMTKTGCVDVPTYVSLTEEGAKTFGEKMTKYVSSNGMYDCAYNKTRYLHHVFGYVVVKARFTQDSKVSDLGRVSDKKTLMQKVSNENNCDVCVYEPNWVTDKTKRYVIHPSCFKKLQVVEVKLFKNADISEHVGFCILNTIAGTKICHEQIGLIRELLSSKNSGRTFSKLSGGEDPYYQKYLDYKTKYLLNKHKKKN